ncbi:MAG: 50S ribosomal protein L17 [Candidatus Omnitrophica bacterium]|jgi:large subunit ribosomal protein L17|nr:50S ribosomal protein L17 [Candidatus Omnitrophota bacterium]MDD3274723.1 50S ribosomal protein L17 [Candidatus Omnitrophota bacterium]MDD5724637.1 50S ribosomal protein L17 [Candidatus Omnitrophota bacterium]
MRHAKKRLQLGRFTSWHDGTIKSMARNMVICQSMKTTVSRAKASKQLIEKLVSLGKSNTLFARRQAQEILGEHKLVNILFNDIAPRFAKRNSGFTRIIGLGKRRGDNAEMAIFELTELKKKEPKKTKIAKDAKPHAEIAKETPAEEENDSAEEKKETRTAVKDRPVDEKKPQKKFMGGLRTIFKKKSDSL